MNPVLLEIAAKTAELYRNNPKEIWLLDVTPKKKGRGIEIQVQSNIKEACRDSPYFCEIKYTGPDINVYKDEKIIVQFEVKAGVDASRYWMYDEGLKRGFPCIFLSPSEIIKMIPEAKYYTINKDWVIGVLESTARARESVV